MHKGLLHQADDHLRLPRREHLQAIIDSVRTLTTNNQAEKMTERFTQKGEDQGRRHFLGNYYFSGGEREAKRKRGRDI